MPEYVNVRELGRGASGIVWLCERAGDGARFAKKVLRDDARGKTIERFKQEAQILAKLDHPNLVKAVEADLDGPILWYLMPYYRTSLQAELDGVIGDPARVVPIFSAILDGVEHAHEKGVIHRDLKPHNVLMNSDADLAVCDFGISRVLDADGDRVTRTGARMGTAFYMSPEQTTDSKHADHRTDIFGLGRMLYELYTERLNTAVQEVDRLPTPIAPILRRCTEYRPDDRYPTVTDLKAEWRAATTAPLAGEAEARRLIAEVVRTPQNAAKVRELFSYLDRPDTDGALLRDALMRVPVESVASPSTQQPDLIGRVVKTFCDQNMAQGATAHLDAVATRCGNLFMAVQNPAVRADLVNCLLHIGVEAKRYAALTVLSDALQTVSDARDKLAIRARLVAVSKQTRDAARQWLDLEAMDVEIAEAFQ